MWWWPDLSERRQRQVLGVLLVALAGLLIASLATYRAPVPGARPWAEANASGPLGAWLAHVLVQSFGRMVAWGVPLLALTYGWNRLRGTPLKPLTVRASVLTLLALEVLALIGLLGLSAAAWSGNVGLALASSARSGLGPAGSAIALVAALLVTLLVASELGFSALSLAWAYLVREPLRNAVAGLTRPASAKPRAQAAEPIAVASAKPRSSQAAAASPASPSTPRIVTPSPAATESPARERRVSVRPAARAPVQGALVALPATSSAAREAVDAVSARPLRESIDAAALASSAVREPKAAAPAPVAPYHGGLPNLDLLEVAHGPVVHIREDELKAEAQLLAAKLADFGIRGNVTEVHPGPVVTTFEFEPAPGIKVNQITSREDDLALALRASRIRILAPIPGKGAVGVEIPNKSPRKVYLREVLSSDAYTRLPASLKFALGVDVNGHPVGADLTRMPHLLVAGATGSGKSVYLNVLVTSLLFGKGPDELRFLMIDPKMIELTSYNGIPHLLMPVVTDAKRAARSLRWAVGEMERRYRLLAACGARNIEGLNSKVEGSRGQAVEENVERLPYIVVLVDELADLMLTMPVEMEEPIGRLAQMARAVGIHLVLATQRPSVDVLTGVIKANFPSRIAFQVSSKTDSRTILDMNGAENLLGMGDMLFLPGGKPEPTRVHAPFLSEMENARVADFWRESAPGEAGPTPIEEALERSQSADDEDDDELVPEAVRLVVLHQQGSTSLLQRRLKVGYSRASRLMDRLESMGVVGPFLGSKARDVLVDESYLEEHNLR